jgi:hypothetical protein
MHQKSGFCNIGKCVRTNYFFNWNKVFEPGVPKTKTVKRMPSCEKYYLFIFILNLGVIIVF